jgi:Tol biopolymer transport system component
MKSPTLFRRLGRFTRKVLVTAPILASACASLSGAPPSGAAETPSAEQAAAMKAIGEKAKGTIVWSSSRLGNHDLFVMDTDGANQRPITKGDTVDWFPRFSPDGSRILFCRSKKGWVREQDANVARKWDIWSVKPDGSDEKKLVDSASWGTWVDDDQILYVRDTAIWKRRLSTGEESEIVDSTKVATLEGALLQQPQISKDGKYLAITLRGSRRETGIWDLAAKTWTRTGDGCQINWKPDTGAIYWVHPSGNGGSRVVAAQMNGGKPAGAVDDIDGLVMIDIPGRRSHEYFPQLSSDGRFLVWAATQRGHDHDIYDYEIYVWDVTTPAAEATRLTFHSANDRWPDIYMRAK